MDAAWVRKPRRGSAAKTFCQPAVRVAASSQASGNSVIQAYRALPLLMMSVVPTHRATDARSWLLIPKSGQSELIPPSGSSTPCTRKYPQPATISPEASTVLGYQDVLP